MGMPSGSGSPAEAPSGPSPPPPPETIYRSHGEFDAAVSVMGLTELLALEKKMLEQVPQRSQGSEADGGMAVDKQGSSSSWATAMSAPAVFGSEEDRAANIAYNRAKPWPSSPAEQAQVLHPAPVQAVPKASVIQQGSPPPQQEQGRQEEAASEQGPSSGSRGEGRGEGRGEARGEKAPKEPKEAKEKKARKKRRARSPSSESESDESSSSDRKHRRRRRR
jgi:hypothetical protein